MSTPARAGVLLLGLVAVAGACRTAPPPARAPIAPRPPWCREAWAKLPAGAARYDFASDAVSGPAGNTGYASYAGRVSRETCLKPWTVLVFDARGGAGEGTLASLEAAGDAARSLEHAGSAADVIVELEEDGQARRYHVVAAPREPRGVELAGPRSPIVEVVPTTGVTVEQRLGRLLSFGARRYPSERFLLVISGAGWSKELDAAALGRALAAAEAEAGVELALLVTDGGLTLEVITEVAPHARLLVGAPDPADAGGLAVSSIATRVDGTRTTTIAGAEERYASPRAVARDLAVALGGPERRVVAVEAQEVERSLAPALSALSGAMVAYVREDPQRAIEVAHLLRVAPEVSPARRELAGLLARLESIVELEERGPIVEDVRGAIARVRAAVGDVVISAGPPPRLALFVPKDRGGLESGAPAFEATRLARAIAASGTFWRAWLDATFAESD